MKEFLEVIDTIRAEDASNSRLFGGEGVGARHLSKSSPAYKHKLAEASKIFGNIMAGKIRPSVFQEVMTSDDFPFLFGDILDRVLLAGYRETPSTYSAYCNVSTVQDFRTVNRYTTSGAEAVLTVVEEQAEYPESSIGEGRFQYAVKKYGRRLPFSWESMVNDDLNALKDAPMRLGRAARRTEERFVTNLFVGTAGPDGTFYAGGNSNVVTSNPVLSMAALQTAYEVLGAQVDEDGEPILIDAVHLVVPRALEVVAKNIINAIEIRLLTSGGATSDQGLVATNWMKTQVTLHVNPYISIIADTNGTTSWFLFADPRNNRPAMEIGFLRGHESPEIFIKAPNAQRVGGGGVDALGGDFDTDSIQYKVRHIMGGTLMDPKMSVASQGDGS